MAIHIRKPTQIKAAGNKPKVIKEYIGRVNTKTDAVSVAYMESPAGWLEPGQTPEFDEYTLVMEGTLHVKTPEREFDVAKGESIVASKGEWVQYSSPYQGGAKYVAVCHPAFSPETVHRDV